MTMPQRPPARSAFSQFLGFLLLACLLLGAGGILGGCAPREPRPARPPDVSAGLPAPATPTTPGAMPAAGPGHQSLQAFATARAAEFAPPLRAIFTPPQGDHALNKPFFLTLSRTVQETPLVDRVLAHATDGTSLAFSREDGRIGIVSSWPCHDLALPGTARAVALSLSTQAGRLAALDEGNQTLRVFDLKACGELPAHATPTPVATMALSPDGQTLGYADAAYGLWAGPALATEQGFQSLARLRFITLDVGFSPRGGLLVVVDQVGWVTIWKLPEGQVLKTLRLPGGPFQEARLTDSLVLARTVQGEAVTFDLAATPPGVVPAPPPAPLVLREGVLFHTAGAPRLHRALHLGRVPLQAWWHGPSGVLTLRDVDGVARRYTLADGRPAPSPPDPGHERGDPLQPDSQLAVSPGGTLVQLAFPLYKTAGMTLYCRPVAEEHFLLWWDHGEHPAAPATPPPGLPRLPNAFATEPAGWIPLD